MAKRLSKQVVKLQQRRELFDRLPREEKECYTRPGSMNRHKQGVSRARRG